MEIVPLLCASGAGLNAADQVRRAHAAAPCRRTRRLTLHDAPLAQDGDTPLHKAARAGKRDVVAFLLQKDARRSVQNHVRCPRARPPCSKAHTSSG
jgi:hypothetical protein